MRYIRLWLLTFSLVNISCASRLPRLQVNPVLTIDFTKNVAYTSTWSAPLTDCTDKETFCYEAEERFIISYLKICPIDNVGETVLKGWNANGSTFKALSPRVHLGFPSGSYFSEKYPNVLLYYSSQIGFTSLTVGPSSVKNQKQEFDIKVLPDLSSKLFACSK